MEERLQKFMASCGVASRRKCEDIILEGRVKVNGTTVNKLGIKVNKNIDKVTVDDELLHLEKNKVYIALNKPESYISTVKDERGRKTLLDLVKVKERVYPIGRLDYDTSGLILLTNDGSIYNKIIHPRQEKQKKYVATISGIPTEKELVKFKTGIDIDGYVTAAAKIKLITFKDDISKVIISIHEGKNRQIRRMCDKINHPIISLKRISIGKIELGNLELGKWRYLSKEEIDYLKSL